MKVTMPKLTLRSARFTVPLRVVLNAAWWAVLVVGSSLLVIDGLVFYQYGLGHVASPAAPPAFDVVSPEERVIREAAQIIVAKRAAFKTAEPAPSDLPNPFR